MPQSPGLVVMGDDSWSRGYGFESRRRILDEIDIFSHWFVLKLHWYLFEKTENKQKEAGVGPFKKDWPLTGRVALIVSLFPFYFGKLSLMLIRFVENVNHSASDYICSIQNRNLSSRERWMPQTINGVFKTPPEIYFSQFEVLLNSWKQTKSNLRGSHGLVVMGGDSCSEGCGFKFQRHILDGHVFTCNRCKICNVC